jgi:hypothetical protein
MNWDNNSGRNYHNRREYDDYHNREEYDDIIIVFPPFVIIPTAIIVPIHIIRATVTVAITAVITNAKFK